MIFWDFYHLPLTHKWGLISNIESTQPSLICRLFGLSPPLVDILYEGPQRRGLGSFPELRINHGGRLQLTLSLRPPIIRDQ